MCEIDPGTHKGMHSVLALKLGVTAMPPQLHTLHSWATVWSNRVDNMTDKSQEEMS
jgi:hypothetical protein